MERENTGDKYRDIGKKREEHGRRYRERGETWRYREGKQGKRKIHRENEKEVETERQEK